MHSLTTGFIMRTVNCVSPLLALAMLCGSTALAQTPDPPTGPARELYIPSDQLDVLFQRERRGVLMSRDEFLKLLRQAETNVSAGAGQLPAIAAESVRISVSQADQHALVQMDIRIRQAADGWQSLRLPAGNLLVESAVMEGVSAPAIGRDPQDPQSLLVAHDTAGTVTLSLTLSTPLIHLGSDRMAAFQLPRAVASQLTVSCPAGQQLLFNDLQLARPEASDVEARYVLPVGTAEQVRLKWTAERQQTEAQTLVFVSSDVQLRMQQEAARWISDSRVSIFGGSINQLVARVPARMEITGVDSTGLESWKLEDDPDHPGMTRVTLAWRQAFTDDRMIRIQGIAALDGAGPHPVPTLEFADVTAHTGRLAVTRDDGLRLIAKTGGGVRAVAGDMAVTRPGAAQFDFWTNHFELQVAVKPRDRELFGELISVLALEDTTAAFTCTLTIESLNAPLFDLPLHLPADWQLVSVKSGGTPLVWRAAGSAGQILVLPADPVLPGGLFVVTLELTRTISDPETEQRLALPVVVPAATTIVGGGYTIRFADDLNVAPISLNGLGSVAGSGTELTFRNLGTELSGELSISRRKPRLASRTVVRTWADSRQRTVDAEITIDVVQGTTRLLTVRLPENLGADVRFQVSSVGVVPGFEGRHTAGAPAIVEQTPGDPVAGMRPFQLKLDRRFSGSVTLAFTAHRPRQPAEMIDAPRAQVADTIRQHGVIVFEASPEQMLQTTTDVSQIPGLFVADAALAEGPVIDSGRRVALVYRFVQPDYSFAVEETRYTVEMVPSAVMETIHHVCTLNDSGEIQRYCSAVFLSSGVQTLRFALPSPESSFLWSTVLNGEPVEVRRDGADYLVAIPPHSEGAKQTLEVLFEDRDESIGVLGNVKQSPIRFSIDIRDQASAPIDILQQSWDVRYPFSSRLVDSDGEFRAVSGTDQPGWFRAALEPRLTNPFPLQSDIWLAAIFLLFLSITTTFVRHRLWRTLAATSLLTVLTAVMVLLGSAWLARRTAWSRWTTSQFFSETSPLAVSDDNAKGDSAENWRFMRPEGQGPFGTAGRMGGGGGMGGGGMGGSMMGSMGGMGGGMGGMGGGMMGGSGGGPESGMGRNAGAGSFGMPPGATPFEGQIAGLAPGPERIGVDMDFNVPPSNTAGEDSLFDGAPGPKVLEPGDVTELSPGLAVTDAAISGLPGPGTPGSAAEVAAAGRDQLRKGSARLSVRVGLEMPEDFRSRRFQSLGDAVQTPGSLQLVVQSQDRISAIRVVVTLTIILLCWWIGSAALLARLGVVTLLVTAAIAALPLAPNQWQSALDGVIFGSLAGAGIWFIARMLKLVRKACSGCRNFGSFVAGGKAQAASVLLCFAGVMTSPVSGQTTAPAGPLPVADSSKPVPALSADRRPDIVVPYSPDEPALRASRVFVGHDEFVRIYNQANPGALATRSVSPIGSTVVAAFYKADRLTPVAGTDHILTVTARYLIVSDSSDSTSVELPLGPVAIRSARLDGRSAVLQPVAASAAERPAPGVSQNTAGQAALQNVQEQSIQSPAEQAVVSDSVVTGRPAYTVLIGSRGAHVVDLEFDVAARADAVSGRVDLPLRPVASGALEFLVPTAPQSPDGASAATDIRVNGRSNVCRRDGQTIILPIAASGDTRIQWQPAARRSSGDVVTHSTVTTAMSVQDQGLQLRSTIALNCRQGEVTELEVVVPADYVVQSVTGDDVAGWSVGHSDSVRILKLLFRRAVADETRVTLQLYTAVLTGDARSSLSVPILAVRGAARDSGTVLLRSGSQFQVRSESLSGVTQVNPDDAPDPTGDELSGRRMLAWRYTRHPAAVTVRVTRQAEAMQVSALHAVRLEEQRQLWTSQLTVQITGAPRSRLELIVPKSFLALDVQAHGLSDWYLDDSGNTAAGGIPAETRILSLQLDSARLGIVDISIQGQVDRDTEDGRLTMHVPQITDATEASSQLAVWLDAASENAGIEAGDWSVRPPAGIDGRYRSLQDQPASAAFVSSAPRPGPVTVLLRQAVPTMIGESVTVTNVTETSVDLLLALNWRITRAASDTFVVDLPSPLAAVLSFNLPDQRRLIREDRGNGRTRLTFQLQKTISDRLFLIGSGSLPLPAGGEIRADAPDFISACSPAETLSGQAHFWVLVNQSGGLLQPAGDHQKHEVETSQITISIPPELLQQAVTIQRLVPDTVDWTLRFPGQHQTAPAVVTLASHVTVLADDGSWRSRHQLQVRNESRQFLPVRIPEGSRLLYCLVRQKPTRVVLPENSAGATAPAPARDLTDGQLLLIPIPQSGAIGSAFNVEFTLAGNFGVAGAVLRENWTSSRVKVPIPAFPEFRDDPEFGVTISRNRWSVFVPESWKVRPVDDPAATNVIPAAEQDLQDAYLLSQVELTSGLLNSLNSAKGQFARQRLYSALQTQQGALDSFTGNTASAKLERSQILSRLNEVAASSEFESVQGAAGGVMAPPQGVRNLFLYEQDLNQNSFSNRSELGFIAGNGIQAETFGPLTPADGVAPGSANLGEFRFQLPPAKPKEPPIRSNRIDVRSPDAAQGKQAATSEEAAAAEKSGARSQLIQRRDSAMKKGEQSPAEQRPQAADEAQQVRTEGDSDAKDRRGRRGPPDLSQTTSAPSAGAESFDPATAGPTGDQLRGFGEIPSAPSAGLLSLQFDIPADGERHDFLRTGGNSALSFDVRAARAVKQGFGAVWAVLCSAAALPLVVSWRRGERREFLNRLLFLVAVAGLAGRLANIPLSGWCLGMSLAAAVCLSVSLMQGKQS